VQALDPAVVAAIDDLELAARLIVEDMRSGPHRSPFHGFSTEFSQHRAYRPGDDFRHLDWKLLARTDRLYSRQFRETTNLSAMLVVDASASMDFPAAGLSKFRYATVLAAALAYLLIDGGDRAGLMTSGAEHLAYLPARGGRSHLQALLLQLERLRPSGSWDPTRVIGRAADLLKRRGLVIVISDFYDAESDTLRELKRVAYRGHEVTMLHVVARPELTFDYGGPIEFEDLESGARQLVDTAAAAARYRASVTAFVDGWRERATRDGLDYARFVTDEAPADALRAYLIRRGSRSGSRRNS
jgi:uncharacterized protein (DUF58 family)